MMQTHLYMAIKRFGENTWDDSDACQLESWRELDFGCWSEVQFSAKTAQHTRVIKKKKIKRWNIVFKPHKWHMVVREQYLLYPSLHPWWFKSAVFLSLQLPARFTPMFQAPVLPEGQRWGAGMTWTLSHSNERGTALSLSKLACSSGRTVKSIYCPHYPH